MLSRIKCQQFQNSFSTRAIFSLVLRPSENCSSFSTSLSSDESSSSRSGTEEKKVVHDCSPRIENDDVGAFAAANRISNSLRMQQPVIWLSTSRLGLLN